MADVKISELGAAVAVTDSYSVPVDNGTNTNKASMPVLREYMTGNLAALDTVNKTSAVAAINEIHNDVIKRGCYVVTINNVSALPVTVTDAGVTSDMVCPPGNMYLSNSAAQTDEWTIDTNNGNVTISGSISGSTNITLYLEKQVN